MRWHHFILRRSWPLARGVNAARLPTPRHSYRQRRAGSTPQSAVPVINTRRCAPVDDAVRQVREGASLSRSLGKAKLFPPLVIHLIASGEAWRLDTCCSAADAQSRELEGWVKTLTALLEPVLILTMGLVVLFIVVAILLPIFEMNQLIK
jgi:general secretion pathway protein F